MPDQTSVPTMPESAAPPVVTGAPREIADGVYVIPDRRVPLVPNVGIILGDRAALVVDTGFGPRSGANTHTAARELAADRPLFVTLTHSRRALADFFRLEDGKVVEHWDVIQDVPATSANDNGMF